MKANRTKIKRAGTEPCGTPGFIIIENLKFVLATEFLSEKLDANQAKAFTDVPAQYLLF